MNSILSVVPFSARLDFLGPVALKGTGLLVVALLAGLALRRVSAARRYVLWFSTVLAVGALTIAAPLLPAWRVLPAREVPVVIEPPSEPEEASAVIEEQLPVEADVPVLPPVVMSEPVPMESQAVMWPVISWSDVVTSLPLMWLIVAAALCFRLVVSGVRLSLLRRRCAAREVLLKLNRALAALVAESGRAAPRLLIGPAGSVPMVWGILRPCLLLPADADEWPEKKLRAVLLHELAHLRRRDPAALLVAQIAQALHWFNPLAWLTVRSLRADQERACDDAVLRHGIRASDYAQHLLDISQHQRLAPGLGLCALAMARSAPVEKRLAAILDSRIRREATSRGALVVSLLVASVIAMPLAMLASEAAKGLRGRILDRHGVVLAESTKETVRQYPLKTLAAHVVGYTGKSGPDDPTPEGRAAMEKQMNAALKKGKDVALSLDARIQALATQAVKDSGFERAAVVVLNPRTGEVLASVSLPSYDPNHFIPTLGKEDWDVYVKDKSLPLFDRCLRGEYCPGSAFAPFTALAGMAAGVGDQHFDCKGSVEYDGRSYRCWIAGQNPAGHGTLGVSSAIVASCNCYWYQFGNAAGLDAFAKMGQLIGIGETTGVIDDEAKGELPSPAGLAATFGLQGKWTPGHTANLAIGQGNLLTTPLQLAVLAATVGNGGKVPKATLLRLEPSAKPEWRADLIAEGLPANQIEQIREGMRLVVNSESGTGKSAHSERCIIAGKTGTSQFSKTVEGKRVEDNRAMFMGFAPFDQPTLAFAVLVEGGKSGGRDAAPIAKRIVEETLALPADGSGKVESVEEQAGHFKQIDSTAEEVRKATVTPKSDAAAKLYSALLQNDKAGELLAESKALLAEQPESSVRKLIAGFAHWRNGDTKAAASSCQKINCNDLSPGQQAIFARIANDAGFKDAALTVVKGIPVDALLMKSEAAMIAPMRPDAPQRQTLAGASLRVVHQSGRAVEVKGPGVVPLRITTSKDARGLRLVEVRNLPDIVNAVAVVEHGHETTELRFGKTKGIATDEATILFDGNATPAPDMPANQWRGTIDGHLEIYHSGTRKQETLDGSVQLNGAEGELRLEKKSKNEKTQAGAPSKVEDGKGNSSEPQQKGQHHADLDDVLREGGKLGGNAIPPQMPSDQIFEDGSDHFNDRAKLTLMKLGFLIEKNPGTLFVITCYTDSVGDDQANLELSQRRADAVATWLRQNLRLTTQRIKAVGMGEKELIETSAGADKEARRVNQRLEIKVRTSQVDQKAAAQSNALTPGEATTGANSPWKMNRHGGRDYVTLENVKSFYHFDSLSRNGTAVELKTRSVVIKAEVGSRELHLNGVKFLSSDPVVEIEGNPSISQLDLVRLIDPVLRPSHIKNASAFDTVVIDPGHGGHDEGAKGVYGIEKDMTLKFGMNLKTALEKRGFKVVMTRTVDEFKSLASRVKQANDTPDSILISLHFNSGDKEASGVETHAVTPQVGGDPALNSQNIALATAIHARVVTHYNLADRGVRRAQWTVLTGCERPAILFEGGFITNGAEARMIASETYRKALAETMADGVLSYQKAIRSASPAKTKTLNGQAGTKPKTDENDATDNAAAEPLRRANAKLYNFERARLDDVFRRLAADAGIRFISMPDDAPELKRLITHQITASPFSIMETFCRANRLQLFLDGDTWYLRPFDDSELLEKRYASPQTKALPDTIVKDLRAVLALHSPDKASHSKAADPTTPNSDPETLEPKVIFMPEEQTFLVVGTQLQHSWVKAYFEGLSR